MATKRRRWRLPTQLLLSQLAVLLVVAVCCEVPGYLLGRQLTAPAWSKAALLVVAAAVALLLGVIVTFMLTRRVKRMFGLELEEIAPMLRQVERMAMSRESLRRVAMLVASDVPGPAVFSAVAEEAGRLVDADAAQLYRYEADGSQVQVAAWGAWEASEASGDDATRRGPVTSTLIMVDGRAWGRIVVTAPRAETVGGEPDPRITAFAELAAAAISNAQARASVAASRKRVLTAADEARRKIERNLHDGVQQRLVTLVLQARHAYDTCPGPPGLRDELCRMTEELASLLEELREISRGVHPAVLSQAGLGPALRSLARRAALPVRLSVDVGGRLPEPLEVAAYYVVSEALANAAKHSGAAAADVAVAVREGLLDVRVADDGSGGADEAKGSGIVGLRDRVEALGGTMAVASPRGGGTAIHVELPVTATEGNSPNAAEGSSANSAEGSSPNAAEEN